MIKTYFRKRLLNKLYTFNESYEVYLPTIRYKHVFVFGSNLRGAHIGGAASVAKYLYLAQDGVAQGPTGNSYAIPTIDVNFEPLKIIYIAGFVKEFKKEAALNPNVTYHLTPIGCGIAGYKPSDIAPLFLDVTKNVILPLEFKEVFLKEWDWFEPFFKNFK